MNITNSFSHIIFKQNLDVSKNQTQTKTFGVSSDVFCKSKVSFGSSEKVSPEEMQKIKKNIKKGLINRNFSPKVIQHILNRTSENNCNLSLLLSQEKYCFSGTAKFAVNCSKDDKEKSNLIAQAVLYKDYDAIFGVDSGMITQMSQIKDLRDKVTKEYRPIWKEVPKYSFNEIQKEKDNIEKLLVNRNVKKDDIEYIISNIDAETVNFIKMAAKDKDCSINDLRWISPHANIENEKLLRYALDLKYYPCLLLIAYGECNTKSDVDARVADRNKKDSQRKSYSSSNSSFYSNNNSSSYSSSSSSTNSSNKTENKNMSNKQNFIQKIDGLMSHRRFSLSMLSTQDIQNLAKILDTTPDQITNMHKKEFRRLNKNFHPDKNPNDKDTETYYNFIHTLYSKSPSKDK